LHGDLTQTQEKVKRSKSLIYVENISHVQVINLYLKQGDTVDGDHAEPLDELLDEGVVNFGFEHVKF